MQDKTVIITGAGFSAPANIPTQNRILDEMIKQENNILDISANNIELDNEKFLDAFVRVGLYLLINYGDISQHIINERFDGITNEDLYKRFLFAQKSPERIVFFNSLIDKVSLIQDEPDKIYKKNIIHQFLIDNGPSFDEYFQNMTHLKGEVKRRLEHCNLKISLEDVFTAFDKTTMLKKHTRNYTYHEEDLVQQSILRLFIYFFAKILKKHSFDMKDYLKFTKYVEENQDNTCVITTNWDTLVEGYFKAQNINYDLCLNKRYFKYDDATLNKKRGKASVKLIKLHGSINWFKCLQCGNISIIEKSNCGEYLLSEKKKEKCICCGVEAKANFPLIQPEIITPTMVKTYDNQLYKNLWNSAAEELRSATKIIFLGYSLPTADFELKYLLQNNIISTAKIDVVLHSSDNPIQLNKKTQHISSLLPEKRYNDAFIKNECNYFYEGFGKYFD